MVRRGSGSALAASTRISRPVTGADAADGEIETSNRAGAAGSLPAESARLKKTIHRSNVGGFMLLLGGIPARTRPLLGSNVVQHGQRSPAVCKRAARGERVQQRHWSSIRHTERR